MTAQPSTIQVKDREPSIAVSMQEDSKVHLLLEGMQVKYRRRRSIAGGMNYEFPGMQASSVSLILDLLKRETASIIPF